MAIINDAASATACLREDRPGGVRTIIKKESDLGRGRRMMLLFLQLRTHSTCRRLIRPTLLVVECVWSQSLHPKMD